MSSPAESSAELDRISKTYQQKNDIEHVLHAPDTYMGSIEMTQNDMWTFDLDLDIDNGAAAAAASAVGVDSPPRVAEVGGRDENEDDGEGESVEPVDDSIKIHRRTVQYIPGLFKMFDEAIVNCRDHVIRMITAQQAQKEKQAQAPAQEGGAAKPAKIFPVKNIEITVRDDGTIVMYNDGNGVDVVKHPVSDLWIPEMIFGRMRSSTNYDKTEKKIVGGKNGFGLKIVFIWSTVGSVETVDHTRGLKYVQAFNNNMADILPPKITKCKTAPYTRITFRPDYARMGIDGLTSDMISLFKRRAYDISAVTDKSIKVKYNAELVPTKNFQEYVDLYIGTKSAAPRVYESVSDRWEYAISLAPNHEFTQVSFVNGIYTGHGGKHVDYILNQITRKMIRYIEQKKKVKVTASSIKEQIMLFVRCDIENPTFSGQTKEYMDTLPQHFGSTCEVSDKTIEKLAKMGIMSKSCALTEITSTKVIARTDGSKCKRVMVPKLVDANWAGSRTKSRQCILLICEGDSAKAGVLSGLSSSDRDIYGIYPMKGKILNVRDETSTRIRGNAEIRDLIQILGLSSTKTYESMDDVAASLRYGQVLFMTDQDLDGSHIKGLLLNLFACEWGSLLKIKGFFGFMNTPILKASRRNEVLEFYNNGEYTTWKDSVGAAADQWSIKYYKGLGTSTAKEFKAYFKNIRTITFDHTGDVCNDTLDLAFRKNRAQERKTWIGEHDDTNYLDTGATVISYTDFVNRELIHFSVYDCHRNIPNIMDGLKPGARKVLFSAFKRNLNNDIKVATFSGYVAEHSDYHHGEVSLHGTVVGMAQNYLGSNNINLFMPNGQFGTRLKGGKDSASPRYIFTQLTPITRYLFPKSDDMVLRYLSDEGSPIEPEFYAPVIPMVLVNGSSGIGTGYSSDVMCYSPREIVAYLKYKLSGAADASQIPEFAPYYEEFTGTVRKLSAHKYLFTGVYTRLSDDTIRVTELPVGTWTTPYKTTVLDYLVNPEAFEKEKEKSKSKKASSAAAAAAIGKTAAVRATAKPQIKQYVDHCSDSLVDYEIQFEAGKLASLEAEVDPATGCNGVEKLLKLTSTQTTTNMHLFDAQHRLKLYKSPQDIIDQYYPTRLEMYAKRKQYMVEQIQREILVLSNKSRFIREILDESILLLRKSADEVRALLTERSYATIADKKDAGNDAREKGYKYLVDMPMSRAFKENADKLFDECAAKERELIELEATEVATMWIADLDAFLKQYPAYLADRVESKRSTEDEEKAVAAGKKKKSAAKKAFVPKRGVIAPK